MLSYAGGLFGIIIGFFIFFLESFNEYKYELTVAGAIFTVGGDKKHIKAENFHFLLYVKYAIYDWIKTLFCYEFSWKDCHEVDQSKEEAVSQMDIINVFKKLEYLENMG